jgi:probable rRNA maturation factor
VKKTTKKSAKKSTKTRRVEALHYRQWKVHVSVNSKALGIGAPALRNLMLKILRCVDREIAPQSINEVHLLLVNDAQMREINFEFRNKDKATDVLSFPQFRSEELAGKKRVSKAAGSYLGDLVISTETTLEQAKRFEVTKREELVRLLVHGVLHLCGYDHEKVPKSEAERMRRRERAIRAEIIPGPKRAS